MNLKMGKQYLIAGCLYLGQLVVGYTLGWAAPVLAKLKNPEETPLEDVISDGQDSWIVSFIYLGNTSGPYISGYLSNTIGRKPCLLLGGSVYLIGYVQLALAKQLPVILVGRLLTGVGNGILFITNLVYIGEMASTHIRGTLLTLTGLSSSFGILLVYSVGPFVPYSVISWVAAALSGVYLVGICLLVPESPVYQAMADKNEEAKANLISLGRQDDIDEVVAKANKTKPFTAQMADIFKGKTNRRALFIIISLNILQQMSGVIAILSFVTIIFDLSGSSLQSHVSTIIVGVTQIFAASIAPLLVERIGRKSLLLFSTAACALSLATLGTYFNLYYNDHSAASKLQWLSLVSLMSFFLFYYIGLGIIPNTFVGEMLANNVRSFGSTFTVTVGWIFGFGVTTAFGYMVPSWGADVTFWIYASVCAIAFIFSIVFVPETKGKSLLKIQEMLGNSCDIK